jgi:redox-sensitive bicupin YhaK (pirin superfamily)
MDDCCGGILHKEFHEKEWAKKGGVFQMVQLWVNLPKEYKMGTPRYQAIENKNFKAVSIDDDGSKVEIIAGEYKGVEGTALTFSPIHLWNVIMKKGASVKIDLPKDFNTLLLALKGSVTINDAEELPVNNLALMANDGDYFELKAIEDCVILLMSGEPFDEPIAAYGPFVMNTREEIYQAFEDFNEGKFGYLE